jgi:hypothetical protein
MGNHHSGLFYDYFIKLYIKLKYKIEIWEKSPFWHFFIKGELFYKAILLLPINFEPYKKNNDASSILGPYLYIYFMYDLN